MMKKIIFLALILSVIYVLIIFKAPLVADGIAKTFGIEHFNEYILKLKQDIDKTSTQTPNANELLDKYEHIKSGAVEFMDATKDRIDTLRITLSGAEETFNEAKNTYHKAVNVIDTTSKKIEDVKQTIDSVHSLTSTGNTY